MCVCVRVNTGSEWGVATAAAGWRRRSKEGEKEGRDVLTEREGGNGCWWLGGCVSEGSGENGPAQRATAIPGDDDDGGDGFGGQHSTDRRTQCSMYVYVV